MSSPHLDRPDEVITPGGLSIQGPHRVEAFERCPQLESFAHELHLRPVMARRGPGIGILVHDGLAYHYAYMLPVEQRPAWLVYENGFEMMRKRGKALFYPQEYIDVACLTYESYQKHYRTDNLYPIIIEHQFLVHFPNGEPYSCRTDLLAHCDYSTPGYCLAVVDHKTGAQMGNEGAKYSIDRQMASNIALARACGYDVRKVIINFLTTKTPFKCERFEVPINPYAYARLGDDTQYWLDRMKAIRLTHPDPMNRPRARTACVHGKFGPCDYMDLCWRGGNINQFTVPAEKVTKR